MRVCRGRRAMTRDGCAEARRRGRRGRAGFLPGYRPSQIAVSGGNRLPSNGSLASRAFPWAGRRIGSVDRFTTQRNPGLRVRDSRSPLSPSQTGCGRRGRSRIVLLRLPGAERDGWASLSMAAAPEALPLAMDSNVPNARKLGLYGKNQQSTSEVTSMLRSGGTTREEVTRSARRPQPAASYWPA